MVERVIENGKIRKGVWELAGALGGHRRPV